MIYSHEPDGFSPSFEVCSVFLEADGSILLLQRPNNRDEEGPLLWSNPGGKREDGESLQEAAIREVREETGIELEAATLLETLYVRHPSKDFVFHLMGASLDERPGIVLQSEEHSDFRWVRPLEALLMPLVPDHDICVRRWLRLR